jgi:hypothetical protein
MLLRTRTQLGAGEHTALAPCIERHAEKLGAGLLLKMRSTFTARKRRPRPCVTDGRPWATDVSVRRWRLLSRQVLLVAELIADRIHGEGYFPDLPSC